MTSVTPSSRLKSGSLPVSASDRTAWIDIMRGFAILLVVIQHGFIGLLNAKLLQHVQAGRFCIFFCLLFNMAVIFFVAGFVSRDHKKTPDIFMRQQLQWIVLPYLVWSVLLVLSHKFSPSKTNVPMDIPDLFYIGWSPIALMWFLYAFFLVKLADYVISRFAKDGGAFYGLMLVLSGLWCCIVYELDMFADNTLIKQIFFGLFFYELGRNAGMRSMQVIKISAAIYHRHGLWLACVTGSLVILISIAALYTQADPDTLMPLHDFQKHVFFSGIVGIAAMLLISMAVEKYTVFSVVQALGIYSMVIYVQHTIWGGGIRAVLVKMNVSSDIVFIVTIVAGGIASAILWQWVTDWLGITRFFGIRPVHNPHATHATL